MGFTIARIIAVILLVLALGRYPYGYYTLIKLVVCGVTVYGVYFASKMEKIGWVCFFGITAVLLNPVIPVHLYSRSAWQLVDLVVAIVLLISIFMLRKSQSGVLGNYLTRKADKKEDHKLDQIKQEKVSGIRCLNCRTEFILVRKTQKFCSTECRQEYYRKKK